jgi:hypothetical protein
MAGLPPEPDHNHLVWYRGWEAGRSGFEWVAYKGGCDLDAESVHASSWEELLDLIDDEMEDEE